MTLMLPSLIFIGACATIIILQLIQGGHKPHPRETHRFIEEKLAKLELERSRRKS